ncbi:hypothetical protein OAR97_01130 [Arcobacteraceae bacterium]|nr:hypothetical protein [Arcobacteraceae bacterium]
MGTQISNNNSTWERITTGLGNSFSTLWDRRDDIRNDISTAYDGGVQGTQTIAGNIFDSTVNFGTDLSNGDYDTDIANSLRFAGTTFNVAGTALLVTPGGQGAAGLTLGLSGVSNYFAEKLDPQPEALIRNSTLDVMTSSMPGGFVKTVGVEVYKATLDNYSDKHKEQ